MLDRKKERKTGYPSVFEIGGEDFSCCVANVLKSGGFSWVLLKMRL